MQRTVLFLCTGNYYRSRFAEIYFNATAERLGLPWQAESRGLALERGVNNVGPLAAAVADRLAHLGIATAGYLRQPQQATEADLRRADRIVALKEIEHRPLLLSRHPGWEERAEYWHVHDDYDLPAAEALPGIERAVEELVRRLREGEASGHSPAEMDRA